MDSGKARKSITFLGDSRARLKEFPEDVRWEIGFALDQAELGETHPSAKPMQGIGAVEIICDFNTDTFRGVYTTAIKENIYVLHCFKKKSTSGIKTPKRDIALIKKRLAIVEALERENQRATKDQSRAGKR